MQRTYHTAIALVHHASKKHRAQPGQALRGSSDLHAFGDSNAYLARRKEAHRTVSRAPLGQIDGPDRDAAGLTG